MDRGGAQKPPFTKTIEGFWAGARDHSDFAG